MPLHVSVPFLRPSSGGSWTVLCQVTKLRSVDIRSLGNCAVCGLMSLQYVCVCVWCSLLSETLSWSLLDKVSLSKEHQTRTQTVSPILFLRKMFTSHNGDLIHQSNSISPMGNVILQIVMTYGRKPHNSITNV